MQCLLNLIIFQKTKLYHVLKVNSYKQELLIVMLAATSKKQKHGWNQQFQFSKIKRSQYNFEHSGIIWHRKFDLLCPFCGTCELSVCGRLLVTDSVDSFICPGEEDKNGKGDFIKSSIACRKPDKTKFKYKNLHNS